MAEHSSLDGDQTKLIRAFADGLRQHGETVELFETHISLIVVAGALAYKFKKAVHFDFLDFSTLAARHFYCQEELRLNRRLAPALYLDVVALGGTRAQPVLVDEAGAALEYAVRMRSFAQAALWSRRIADGLLGAPEIDALAIELAQFHQRTACAPPASNWGAPALLRKIAEDNLDVIDTLGAALSPPAERARLRAWHARQAEALAALFARRRAGQAIRECHGDLHSGNILTLDGRVTMFDCIEFNEALRWIDVIDELAFICMDLDWRGLPRLAARLLNAYLEAGGDYAGLGVFGYYRVERALIRAKVALLRAHQLERNSAAMPAGASAASAARTQAQAYLAYAARHLDAPAPALIIMHGFAGSGKSTVSQDLLEALMALRLRSDVERKRLHGLAPAESAEAPYEAGLYRPDASRQTYAHLARLARTVLAAGGRLVIDAACLQRWQRAQFAALAAEFGVPFCIVSVQAPPTVLRARVAARAQAGGDPSDAGVAVLEQQLTHAEALAPDEMQAVTVVDTTDAARATQRKWKIIGARLMFF